LLASRGLVSPGENLDCTKQVQHFKHSCTRGGQDVRRWKAMGAEVRGQLNMLREIWAWGAFRKNVKLSE
jgi:hypothetical protein